MTSAWSPARTWSLALAGIVALSAVSSCRRPASIPAPLDTAQPLSTAQRPSPLGPPSSASSDGRSLHPPTWPDAPNRAPAGDRGIFLDLQDQVRLWHPSWLRDGPVVVVSGNGARYVAVAGSPIALAQGGEGPTVPITELDAIDADGDAIPDPLDILIGAKKTVLNGDYYRSTYRVLDYPNGDLPREEGVCTDVVVRALRNAGIDLQRLVHEDIVAAPGRYPMVKRADRNIDHRRVSTILPYFTRYWRSLPTDGQREPLLPGDVVFLDTLPKVGPDHLGIVSDRLGASGLPLIVNNWTDGYRTSEMDLLGWVPVTHRFRVPAPPLRSVGAHVGITGVLSRAGIRLDDVEHRQLILVTTPLWTSTQGELRRYERLDGRWEQLGRPRAVRIGAAGLGRGRGLGGGLEELTPKREGDRRSPAGVFSLGTAFGPSAERQRASGASSRGTHGTGASFDTRPYAGRWPWRGVGPRDRFVDDPRSRFYNTWQTEPEGGATEWSSAEELTLYSLGLVVEHNTRPTVPGAGSAIFLHPWRDDEAATVGCTSMPRETLIELLGWLDPDAQPVLVQLAGTVFEG